MSQGQWKRLDAIGRWREGELTQSQVAQGLGLSERQVRRLRRAIEARGTSALEHGNAGRAPWNKTKRKVQDLVVKLMKEVYAGFNDQHFTEMLAEREGVFVSRPTVRRLLRKAGIAAVQKRRAKKLRRRRERKPQEGLMLLWDGSKHDWLQGRGPRLCLMAAIDDATGAIMPGAHFCLEEGAVGYLRVLLAVCKERGLPWSIYGDRHSALHRNDVYWQNHEVAKGQQDATQVGEALAELGIESIRALSAQAKGRVERLWRTLQDRLISELRLGGVCTLEEANAFLKTFVARFNRRFSVSAKKKQAAWRASGDLALERICCFRKTAVVSPANTVQFEGRTIDLQVPLDGQSKSSKRALIRLQLDGQLLVEVDGELLARQKLQAPTRAPARRKSAPQEPKLPRSRKEPKKNFKQALAAIRAMNKAA